MNTYKTRLDFKRLSPSEFDRKNGVQIDPIAYNIIQGKIDAYANMFDFINNKTLISSKEMLVFITDKLILNGAENLKISIEK